MAASMVGRLEGPVGFIATAQALDEEMEARINRHREERPDDWIVIEEPIELQRAVTDFDPGRPLIIDCLTLWVSNLMGAGVVLPTIEALAVEAAQIAAGRPGTTVVVSNEVGSGIVPVNPMARDYRDLLGVVNTRWAEHAERVLLLVAGGVVPVQPVPEIFEGGGR
jgi:adenosyl cobinamide kinase/adenosyl cobinamide phosphate guanylyltransferase